MLSFFQDGGREFHGFDGLFRGGPKTTLFFFLSRITDRTGSHAYTPLYPPTEAVCIAFVSCALLLYPHCPVHVSGLLFLETL